MTDSRADLYQTGYSGLTHASIATSLGKTLVTEDQTVVTNLIAAIERHIARQTNRQFKYIDSLVDQVYYETIDGGIACHYTKSFPIKEVTKITLDGVAVYTKGGSSNTYILNEDFFVFDDRIDFDTRLDSAVNNKRAVVVYYSIVQFWGEDVTEAIREFVGQKFLTREYAGKNISRMSSAGVSIDFAPSEIPDYVKDVIGSYRKLHI